MQRETIFPGIQKRLRAARVRPTYGRIEVLVALMRAEGTPTSREDLAQRLADAGAELSVSSMNRCLRDLVDAGVVQRDEPDRFLVVAPAPPAEGDTQGVRVKIQSRTRMVVSDSARLNRGLMDMLAQYNFPLPTRSITISIDSE
ncbi:hypothetical protein [Achromobacter aloeverae]|uniref:Fur family transcriptional regulator n=1 Tax=Achromobacter aloeverae TaxID=1750518 RepID=A0A4Q1HJ91_9BURK|nr:hypothetical protein [Achromobacter aloeverae]RXN87763.1 hypothetical protein C7R54_14280 [Achromobacter aloeverae]